MEHFAGRVHPVFQEDALELRDDEPLDLDVRVAPLRGIAGVSSPAVIDRETAAESIGRPVDRRCVRLPAIEQ
jgi:hypothetical protein